MEDVVYVLKDGAGIDCRGMDLLRNTMQHFERELGCNNLMKTRCCKLGRSRTGMTVKNR